MKLDGVFISSDLVRMREYFMPTYVCHVFFVFYFFNMAQSSIVCCFIGREVVPGRERNGRQIREHCRREEQGT